MNARPFTVKSMTMRNRLFWRAFSPPRRAVARHLDIARQLGSAAALHGRRFFFFLSRVFSFWRAPAGASGRHRPTFMVSAREVAHLRRAMGKPRKRAPLANPLPPAHLSGEARVFQRTVRASGRRFEPGRARKKLAVARDLGNCANAAKPGKFERRGRRAPTLSGDFVFRSVPC